MTKMYLCCVILIEMLISAMEYAAACCGFLANFTYCIPFYVFICKNI